MRVWLKRLLSGRIIVTRPRAGARRRRVAVTACLCVAMLFAQLPQPASAAPSLTLSAACGPVTPGSTTVTATGAGFGASQPVIYELLNSASVVIFGGIQTTLASGGFTLSFEVQQPAGTYTFRTAQDQNGNRAYDVGEPVASAQFTVPCATGGGGDVAPLAHAARLYALMNSLSGTASSIEIASLATMQYAGTISLGARSASSLAVSSDGLRAYVADTTNGAVAVIDLSTGMQLATLAAPAVRDVVLDPTGATLYVSTNSKLIAFSTSTYAQLRTLAPQTTATVTSPDTFLSVAVSPDGLTLATIGFDGSAAWVYLVDAASFTLLSRFGLTNPGEPSNCTTDPFDLTFASAARLLLWDSNCDDLYQVDVPSRTQNTALTIRLGRDDGSSSNYNNALVYSASTGKAFVHTEGGAYGGSLRGHIGVLDTSATSGSGIVGLGGTPFVSVVTPDGSSEFTSVIRAAVTTGATDVLHQYDIVANALHENVYTFVTKDQSVRDMKIIATANAVSGIARCDDPLSPGTYRTLPQATVSLRSGSVEVAHTTADSNGAYTFSGTAPSTTYGIRYTSSDGKIVCAVSVTTDAGGSGTAGLPQLSLHNGTWNTAYRLLPPSTDGIPVVTVYSQTDYLFAAGQSHWFKFSIKPGQKVLVKLVGANGALSLPADYSLALFKDIKQYFLSTQASLTTDPLGTVARQDASTAPDALSPDALSPDALSPDALSPDALSPDALSPDALSPDALSPDELSPDELSPDALSPDALSPDALSPDALSPDALSPDAYSGAQTATILRVSAHQGNSPEQVRQNTWTNTGDFYVRVRGHNGAFAPAGGFTVIAEVVDSACVGVTLNSFSPSTVLPAPGAPAVTTLILTHSGRIDLSGYPQGTFASTKDAFLASLGTFAARTEVNGVVVDLAADAGLAGAYAQWTGDATHAGNPTCPAAANIVAEGIRKIVDAYRPYGLQYVVLAGGDSAIPYYRNPDEAGLGNENMYRPGLKDDSASKASLAFGFVLTQDFYVGQRLQHGDHEYFKPELPIGRLVEKATDMQATIDAYTAVGGVVATGTSGSLLDTGYDFLADTAKYVSDTLGPALPQTGKTLITPPAPNNTNPWTADDLRSALTAQHYTVASLNGHFSANSALAADYATRLLPTDLVATASLLRNTLVLSTGCHSGYNLLNGDALATTQAVDFPQLFASAGATLIGGTGYQYGDTDFRKYSEQILGNVALELTYGTGPVTIGSAHLNSKRTYLSSLATMRGIDEKAIEESTLYGLPMWSIDLGTGRTPRPGTGSGLALDGAGSLRSAVVTPSYSLQERSTAVGTYWDAGTVTAPSISVSPGLPVQPFVSTDVHGSAAGYVARGVVLLGTDYIDEAPVTPFTSAAGTEVGVVHPGFASNVFAPARPFGLNRLAGEALTITPTQYKTASGNTGTLRRWTTPSFKVFYSNVSDASALAGAPVIYHVDLSKTAGGDLQIDTTLGAALSPGVAAVYVTYTVPGTAGGHWTSALMSQTSVTTAGSDPLHPTALTAAYSSVVPVAPAQAGDYDVFIQAVGGNGLVSLSTNGGAYFRYTPPAADVSLTAATPKAPTTLTLTTHDAKYLGTTVVDVAVNGTSVDGLPLVVAVGGRQQSVLIANGAAHATLPVADLPGTSVPVTATLNEDATHLAATAQAILTVAKGVPAIAPVTPSARVPYGTIGVIGRLLFGTPQDGQSVTLSQGGTSVNASTDGYGRFRLDTVALQPVFGPSVIHVVYPGNDLFEGTTADIPVDVPDVATVTPVQLAPQPVGLVTVGASVTANGDITRAVVQFDLVAENGQVSTQTSAVTATGQAAATFGPLGAGIYHVDVTVIGDYYASPKSSMLLVVYDSSTFVTGGGWVVTTVDSTGLISGKKANFGFNAKYKTGTTIPTGSVEFNAPDSKINFKATGFDWLVIVSGRADLQGTGTINGIGSYGFRLIAVDAAPDTFELRIWNASGSFDSPQYKVSGALGGGSIVVH